MKLKTAEKAVYEYSCYGCKQEKHCKTNHATAMCYIHYKDAAKTVIAARDALIAELERKLEAKKASEK